MPPKAFFRRRPVPPLATGDSDNTDKRRGDQLGGWGHDRWNAHEGDYTIETVSGLLIQEIEVNYQRKLVFKEQGAVDWALWMRSDRQQ